MKTKPVDLPPQKVLYEGPAFRYVDGGGRVKFEQVLSTDRVEKGERVRHIRVTEVLGEGNGGR